MKRLCIIVFTSLLLLSVFAQADDTLVLTLDQSIQMALTGNASVLSSEKKLSAAKWKVWEMTGGFFPQITATGSYSHQSEVQTYEIPATAFTPASTISLGDPDAWAIKAGVSWYIFTWGRDFNSYNQSKANYKAADAAFEKAKQDIKLEVMKNFYSLILAEELIKVSQDSLESAQAHFEDAQKGSKVGTVSEVDLLKSEVQYLNMKSQFIKAKNRLTLAKNSFRIMLDLDEGKDFDVDGKLLYEPYKIDLKEGINSALLNSVVLKQIKYQKQAADLAVAIVDAGDKPSIALSYNYNWQKSGALDEDPWDKNWTAGANVSIPIFDGFMTRSKVKQTEQSRDEIKINEENLIRNTKMEIRQIYYELKENEEIISMQEKSVQQAKRAEELTNMRYKQGLATNAEVLDANVVLIQAEINYLQSLYDYNIAQAKWKKATGTL